jgi:hypothetical protein
MTSRTIMLAVSALVATVLVGCGGKTSSDDQPGAEQDLSSSQCPAKIEVELEAPSTMSDDQLTHRFETQTPPETAAEAADTLKMIAPHLKLARGDKAVKLSGELMQACSYKTTRTPAGDNAYGMHFSKSASGFSLRIEQLMANEDELFINVPVTNVSPTALALDPQNTGFISAENTSRGHDGSDGFAFFIGTVKVTAKIAN